MAKFYLDASKLKSTTRAIDNIKSSIDTQYKSLNSISVSDWGGSNTELRDLIDSIAELKKDIGNESKAASDLSTTLGKIIDIYTNADEGLANGKESIEKSAEKSGQGKNEDENVLDKILDLIDQIPEPTKTMLMFLLGCIPGVNVAMDLLSLYGDLKKYWFKDHKLTQGEAAALTMDAVCLVADCMGVFEAYKALKGAKAAKIAAEEASKKAGEKAAKSMAKKESAERIAKEAGKEATEKSAKAAEKAAKAEKAAEAAENVSKRTKAGRRVAKKAGTAERRAEDAEKVAKEAAKKEKQAKNLADNAVTKASKDRNAAKSAEEKVRQAEKKVKEEMKKSVKPTDQGSTRFVMNDRAHRYADSEQQENKKTSGYSGRGYVV